MKFEKYKNNPILKPNPNNQWEELCVLNPAAIYNEEDKTFYKEYKAATNNEGIKKAVQTFCESYHLQIANTDFLDELTICVSGVKKASASTLIKSGAKQFTQTRSKGDVLCVLYGRLAEKMIEAGTLKTQNIPADVRDAYAKKNNK